MAKKQAQESEQNTATEKPDTSSSLTAEQGLKMFKKFETVFEFLQTLAIIIGWRKGPTAQQASSPDYKGPGKRTPLWLLSALEEFSHEDEEQYNPVKDYFTNENPKFTGDFHELESVFCENAKKEGYSLGKYRVQMIGFHRDFIDQLRNPPPEDKSGNTRIRITPMEARNSAHEFYKQLINCHLNGRGPKTIYKCQKKAALDRNLLVKTSATVKTIRYIRNNKVPVTIFLILLPFGIAALIYRILLWLFG